MWQAIHPLAALALVALLAFLAFPRIELFSAGGRVEVIELIDPIAGAGADSG